MFLVLSAKHACLVPELLGQGVAFEQGGHAYCSVLL